MDCDFWLPGVLSWKQLNELASNGLITKFPGDKLDLDNSSFNLHISSDGWEMIDGAIKPSEDNYEIYLNNEKLSKKLTKNPKNQFVLERQKTYIFKLKEEIHFRKYNYFFGQATAKSSIGRMDVLARLIVDGMDRYDSLIPEKQSNSTGELYVEITPITFNVIVEEDISLVQLRIFKGKPEESEIISPLVNRAILGPDKDDDSLSVDLSPTNIQGISEKISGFYTSPEFIQDDQPISLVKKNKYDPRDFWKFCKVVNTSPKRIKVEKDKFYIIRSYEKIRLPNNVAIYCRAMDETFGEMRIHYAGFVHPYFGYDHGGTPLIFEVRGHDVNVNLCDKEPLAKLHFYRMSDVADDISDKEYYDQVLRLSKFFIDWDKLK